MCKLNLKNKKTIVKLCVIYLPGEVRSIIRNGGPEDETYLIDLLRERLLILISFS